MRINKSVLLSALLFVLAVGSTACGTKTQRSKPAARAPSVDAVKLASKAFDQFKTKTPLDDDRRTNAFIVCVAEQVIHDLHGDWEVAIFRKNTPFLFVLPGRKIGIYSGIMQIVRNQHQLASLLAHGVAHVIAHHPDKRIAQQVNAHPEVDFMKAADRLRTAEGQDVLKMLGMEAGSGAEAEFTRAEEAQANVLGLELMARAGFNPREALVVWRSIDSSAGSRSSGFAAVHPSYGKRSASLENAMTTALQLQQQALARGTKPQCDRLR